MTGSVDATQWLAARRELLEAEKEFQQARDKLSAKRRALPKRALIDDYVFEDVGEVQSLLGISDSEWTEISSLVSLFGGVTRIESTGRVGEFEETRIVLAREAEGNSEVSFIVLARFRE